MTTASLGLGSAESGGYTSIDDVSSDLLAWLSTRSPGALPADALAALDRWGGTDFDSASWSAGETRTEVGDRQILTFTLFGDGGVYNGLDICITTDLTWCGIWQAFTH